MNECVFVVFFSSAASPLPGERRHNRARVAFARFVPVKAFQSN
jgi:hypothetical protein